jgi:membrane-bound lytic murein transglycosylase F
MVGESMTLPSHNPAMKGLRRRLLEALALWCALFVGFGFVAGWWLWPGTNPRLAEVQRSGVLRIGVIPAPTTYYQTPQGPAGFEYDLALAFAEHLGVSLEVVEARDPSAALDLVRAGTVDIAATGLTRTPERLEDFLFSSPLQSLREKIVCARSFISKPVTAQDLSAIPVRVEVNSAHAAALERAEADGWRFQIEAVDPPLDWQATLNEMRKGARFCGVIDSHLYALERRYQEGLIAIATLPGHADTGWVTGMRHRPADQRFSAFADGWIGEEATLRRIASLDELYFGFRPEEATLAHIAGFQRSIRERLPRFKPLFEKEAKRTGVPWTLLAAIAYQESGWNAAARSPTGVEGIMMLTQATARSLGVDDRQDPAQSIRGGATYLRMMYDDQPDAIDPQERWWFAFAAYNAGPAHIITIRRLIAADGGDPNHWPTMRAFLSDPANKDSLPISAAKAREVTAHVRRVRDYADILEKRFLVGTEP